jgi:hypothetical protein
MTDRPQTDRPEAEPEAPSLKSTMRRLRIEEAERTGVVVALRDAEFARLAILHDRIRPVLDQVPQGVDLFDSGLTPGETPRLWIDMIAFVEMARDKRTYRFLQDTRNGRRVMAESEDTGLVCDRITAYVAQRLIERERLLALPPALHPEQEAAVPQRAEMPKAELPATLFAASETAGAAEPARVSEPGAVPAPEAPAEPSPPRRERGGIRFSGFGGFVLFLIGLAAGAGGLLAAAQIAARF